MVKLVHHSLLFFSEERSHSNGSSTSLRRRASHSHCSQLCSEMSCLSRVRSFRKGISAHARVSSVTRQMRKQFCPECGNPSLQRASITVDSSGQHHYHLTGRYRPKPRVSISASAPASFTSFRLDFSNRSRCLAEVNIRTIRSASKANQDHRTDRRERRWWNVMCSTTTMWLIPRHSPYTISTVGQQRSALSRPNDDSACLSAVATSEVKEKRKEIKANDKVNKLDRFKFQINTTTETERERVALFHLSLWLNLIDHGQSWATQPKIVINSIQLSSLVELSCEGFERVNELSWIECTEN